MDYYAEIDVSLEWSSVCVVDANGLIIREGKVASDPAALIAWFERVSWFPVPDWKLDRCRNGFMPR